MILFPAIDLKAGQCVRLVQGDMERATVFNADPVAQALSFEAQGFEYLHLVDLDGAFSGVPKNREAVEAILRTIHIPVQLGGGIRNEATLEAWLERGVQRVILGTIALRDPDFVKRVARHHPDRIVVGIDAREGYVAVEGWTETSHITAFDLARRFEDVGVAAIIYTDIARDGILAGLNMEATRTLASALHIPVIASGGLASLQDIETLLLPENACISGAITGRALYDGRLDPTAALALLRKKGAS